MFADTFPNANARVADILKRKRRTPTQTTLDKEEREANIKNAFEIRGEKYIRGIPKDANHSNCRRCHDKRRDAFRMRKNIEARGDSRTCPRLRLRGVCSPPRTKLVADASGLRTIRKKKEAYPPQAPKHKSHPAR